MSHAIAAISGIPTESPQPVQRRAAKPSPRAKNSRNASRSQVLASGNGRVATRGSGEVIRRQRYLRDLRFTVQGST